MVRWRIYYGDGSYYDGGSEEHAWAAPTKNVQLIKIEVPAAVAPRLFVKRHGADFYCWEGGAFPRWSPRDVYGLVDYILDSEGPQKILMGRDVYDEVYQEIGTRSSDEGSFDEMDFRLGELREHEE